MHGRGNPHIHQDAHSHIRELEARLSGILSGDGPRNRDEGRNHISISDLEGRYDPGVTFRPLERAFSEEWAAPPQPDELEPRRFDPPEDIVKRVDNRIEAFDKATARLIASASSEIRQAIDLMSMGVKPEAPPRPIPARAGSAGWISTLLALALVGLAAYAFYLHRQLRAGAVRAAAAEQTALDARSILDERVSPAAQRAEQAAGDLRAIASKAERMIAVMAAPDARRNELIGRQGAPAALGQAIWSRSRGVIITAARLPPAASGETYQVWLQTSEGAVSLGFAPPDALGRVDVAFDLPPQLSGSVNGFSVTREPAGGSTIPSGPVVLSS